MELNVRDTDDFISTLTELGLSATQAKVYLSLAKQRNLKASEISQVSGVARPDVYRVLKELMEAGLVRRIIARPEEFVGISIDECVSALMRRRIEKTAELTSETHALLEKFKRQTEDEQLDEKFQFVLLPKKDLVYAQAEKMLRSVQESLCFLSLMRRMVSWLSRYSTLVEEVLARKVDCRILMPTPEPGLDLCKTVKDLSKYPNVALRLIPQQPKYGFSVWDRKEILITTLAIDTPTPAPSIWSNNKSMVELCQEHFECLWKIAEK